jgi:hypothetical protein
MINNLLGLVFGWPLPGKFSDIYNFHQTPTRNDSDGGSDGS